MRVPFFGWFHGKSKDTFFWGVPILSQHHLRFAAVDGLIPFFLGIFIHSRWVSARAMWPESQGESHGTAAVLKTPVPSQVSKLGTCVNGETVLVTAFAEVPWEK